MLIAMMNSYPIARRHACAALETEMLADLAIGYKMLRETYSSRIELGATADRHRASGQRAVSAFVQSMGV